MTNTPLTNLVTSSRWLLSSLQEKLMRSQISTHFARSANTSPRSRIPTVNSSKMSRQCRDRSNLTPMAPRNFNLTLPSVAGLPRMEISNSTLHPQMAQPVKRKKQARRRELPLINRLHSLSTRLKARMARA